MRISRELERGFKVKQLRLRSPEKKDGARIVNKQRKRKQKDEVKKEVPIQKKSQKPEMRRDFK